MYIKNDKKEMGNNEMPFSWKLYPNMIVMQSPENIEKLNYQEEMPNSPPSNFYIKNQNDSQG